MSKLPKTPAAPPTRKQASRAQRERRLQRYVVGGAIGVALLVFGLLGYAALDQFVLVPRQVVAKVNGEVIHMDEFQKAVRYRRYQIAAQYSQAYQSYQLFGTDPQLSAYIQQQLQSLAGQLSDSESLGRQVLNQLIDDRIIRQEAGRRGLTVSAAEVEERLRAAFEFYPGGTPTPTITPTPFPTDVVPPTATLDPTQAAAWTPTPTITPTATLAPTGTATPGPSATPGPTGTPSPTSTPYTAEGYATEVAQYSLDLKQQTGFSEADLRRLIESQVYREKLDAAFGADVATSVEQVHARHILVADEATAVVILGKLKAGEDWSRLAAEFSIDTSNKDQGGLLDWFAADGAMVKEFEDAAFSTPVGTISQPVQTQFGWHLVQVLAKEQRPLTEAQLAAKRSQAFSDWLTAQRTAAAPDGKPIVETFDVWSKHVPTEPGLPTF